MPEQYEGGSAWKTRHIDARINLLSAGGAFADVGTLASCCWALGLALERLLVPAPCTAQGPKRDAMGSCRSISQHWLEMQIKCKK